MIVPPTILAEMSSQQMLNSGLMALLTAVAVWLGANPLLRHMAHKEREYDDILNRALLLDVPPRLMTILTVLMILVLAFFGYMILGGSLMAALVLGCAGGLLPGAVIRLLRRRRLAKLETQLVGAVQTLASGVRAGLNLIQAMQMIARDASAPIRDEFAHLLREYEYGVPLDEAMQNAAERIESPDFQLLFAALHTHRERGGDLGETLDRIAESIREIQRLENRVKTLTAQGRATARWLGLMPVVVMVILYFIDPAGVSSLFTEFVGKIILSIVVVMNLVGFLWIRKIMSIDI